MTQQDEWALTLPLEDASSAERPIVGHVADGAFLHGNLCLHCSAKYFPPAHICFGCQGTSFHGVRLAGRGRLYSYSTVHVSSTRSVPYTIGYVDLDSQIRILARLADDQPLEPDVDVELARDSTDSNWYFVRSAGDQHTEGVQP